MAQRRRVPRGVSLEVLPSAYGEIKQSFAALKLCYDYVPVAPGLKLAGFWLWVKTNGIGSHFGVGAPPILVYLSGVRFGSHFGWYIGEFTTHFRLPNLVVGSGCSLGVQDFDPWPTGDGEKRQKRR